MKTVRKDRWKNTSALCVKELSYVFSTDTVQSFHNDNSPDALLMNLFITGAAGG